MARAIADWWAKKSPKFDPAEQEKAWNSLNADRPDGVTVLTLFYIAREHGWNDPRSRQTKEPPPPALVQTAETFMRAYIPLSYTIRGILPGGYFYGLTAGQGTGKTAFLNAAGLAIISGDTGNIGFKVTQGRVAYICMENPDDLRMKLAVNAHHYGIFSRLTIIGLSL